MRDLNEKKKKKNIWNSLYLCSTFIVYSAKFSTKMVTLKTSVKDV